MIVWIIGSLLGLATGLRLGWALVHRLSLVNTAMIVALGSLTVVAALNWPPLALLINSGLGWPNISVGLSQLGLVMSAAGSSVMITSVASTRKPVVTRRVAMLQYGVAAVIATVTLALFLISERQPEMAPREYLARNLGVTGEVVDWLVPLIYVLVSLSVVAGVGLRLSTPSRRGRALLVFSVGVTMVVASSGFLLTRVVGRGQAVAVGAASVLLLCAMAVVAAAALLPTVEDWIGARRELRLIEPLRREMARRHPNAGIGVRPRGPLVFQVAERLSLIADSLYLESQRAECSSTAEEPAEVPAGVSADEQARAVALWISAGRDEGRFPGNSWLRQPENVPDRDWILEIARQYRNETT